MNNINSILDHIKKTIDSLEGKSYNDQAMIDCLSRSYDDIQMVGESLGYISKETVKVQFNVVEIAKVMQACDCSFDDYNNSGRIAKYWIDIAEPLINSDVLLSDDSTILGKKMYDNSCYNNVAPWEEVKEYWIKIANGIIEYIKRHKS